MLFSEKILQHCKVHIISVYIKIQNYKIKISYNFFYSYYKYLLLYKIRFQNNIKPLIDNIFWLKSILRDKMTKSLLSY